MLMDWLYCYKGKPAIRTTDQEAEDSDFGYSLRHSTCYLQLNSYFKQCFIQHHPYIYNMDTTGCKIRGTLDILNQSLACPTL